MTRNLKVPSSFCRCLFRPGQFRFLRFPVRELRLRFEKVVPVGGRQFRPVAFVGELRLESEKLRPVATVEFLSLAPVRELRLEAEQMSPVTAAKGFPWAAIGELRLCRDEIRPLLGVPLPGHAGIFGEQLCQIVTGRCNPSLLELHPFFVGFVVRSEFVTHLLLPPLAVCVIWPVRVPTTQLDLT